MALIVIDQHTINFVDSAACELLKIGTGAGESRLYMGHVSKLEYFKSFAENVEYFFIAKRDLKQYIAEAKIEYENPSYNYVHKADFPKIYTDNVSKIVTATDLITLQFEIQYDSQRCYYALKPDSRKDYTILRDICLPKVSQLVFTKIQDTNSKRFYINIMPVFNKQYSAEELGAILKEMYENEPSPKKPAIYLFGFKYAKYIQEKGISLKRIIESSGIAPDYQTELSNAISIFEKCLKYKIGINPNAEQLWGSVLNTDNNRAKVSAEKEADEIQIIYFGAPGTGKSHEVSKYLSGDNNIRTTFHPDTDYSSFVGCYKPTKSQTDPDKITYKFVEQSFVKAYIKSWVSDDPFFLVIEEINRGNCAQIFGDLFQLLDRDKTTGESVYSVEPDTDLQTRIAELFKSELNKAEDPAALQSKVPERILTGVEMKLPANLYIYATMNTSDQSLFPIDSAFKRRWSWKYMAIKNEAKNTMVGVGDKRYDWWGFIETVNGKISSLTSSEDKKIGYWFAIPKGASNTIDADTFVSKVLFYLWNDVFKDYPKDNSNLFSGDWTFFSLFDEHGDVDVNKVNMLLESAGISPVENPEDTAKETFDTAEDAPVA